jgi:hypothetical protein
MCYFEKKQHNNKTFIEATKQTESRQVLDTRLLNHVVITL